MNSIKKFLAAGAASLAIAANLQAGGFAILEQSTAGIGRSLAGMSADIEEPGALFFNPAVGAWFDGPTTAFGLSLLHVDAHFDIKDSSEVQGHDGGNGGGWSYIPNMYHVQPLTDRLALGLGFSATSGTATHWNKYWVGNMLAVDTEIKVVNFTPSLSYKVTDNFSIGAGITIDYCDATMSQAVPNKLYQLTQIGNPLGQLKFRGDSITYGVTLGALYEPVKGTRVGLGFRSGATHEIELEGRIRGIATPNDPSNPMTSGFSARKIKGDADCDLELPAMINLGIQHEINDRWTVMADISWSESSVMEDLTVKFKKDALGHIVDRDEQAIKMGWRDNWRFAVGTDYKLTDKLTVRFGSCYDQTPVDSDKTRVPAIPDLSRVWVSCGFSYAFTENCSLDLSYMKLFFVNDDMDQMLPTGKMLKVRANGDCDIISTGITYRF